MRKWNKTMGRCAMRERVGRQAHRCGINLSLPPRVPIKQLRESANSMPTKHNNNNNKSNNTIINGRSIGQRHLRHYFMCILHSLNRKWTNSIVSIYTDCVVLSLCAMPSDCISCHCQTHNWRRAPFADTTRGRRLSERWVFKCNRNNFVMTFFNDGTAAAAAAVECERNEFCSNGLQHLDRKIAIGFYTPLESTQLKIELKCCALSLSLTLSLPFSSSITVPFFRSPGRHQKNQDQKIFHATHTCTTDTARGV